MVEDHKLDTRTSLGVSVLFFKNDYPKYSNYVCNHIRSISLKFHPFAPRKANPKISFYFRDNLVIFSNI